VVWIVVQKDKQTTVDKLEELTMTENIAENKQADTYHTGLIKQIIRLSFSDNRPFVYNILGCLIRIGLEIKLLKN
jgi:hypothetical protein